jgi:hypothetical protein
MNLRFGAVLLAAGLAGCVAERPVATVPVVTGQVAPTAVQPGSVVNLSYAVTSARAVSGISVVGLPANTLAAGTNANLTIPAINGQAMQQALAVRAPAAAGVYPLQLRVAYADGASTLHPIGTLTIADMPGMIEQVALEPGSHQVGACAAPYHTATLRYTVADANGAQDVVDPKLVVPAYPATASYTVPLLAPVAVAPAAVTFAPAGTVVAVPAQTVVVQPAPMTIAVPTQATQIPLSAPRSSSLAREAIATPIQIACQMPAPVNWTWHVQAADVDQVTGTTRIVGPAPIGYFTR